MKKLLILLSVFLCYSQAKSEETIVKPELQSVKVFLHGAEVHQLVKVKLNKGINDVVLTGIASNIDRNSINVSGSGDGIIISVVQRFDFMRSPEEQPEIKALQDSLEYLNKRLTMKVNEDDILKYELELLLANKNIKNEKSGVSIAELEKMGTYFKKKISELKSQMLQINLDTKKIQKDIDKVTKQLKELNQNLSKPSNEVSVSINAKNSGFFEINLSYVLFDAGWTPNYNVYVDNVNSPAKLNYLANVWQNSGFDWNDVSVVLSTRNPNRNNTKPELNPWYLNFYEPVSYRELKGGMMKTVAMDAAVQNAAAPMAESMANYFEAEETQLAVEFTPTIKYSVPSDGKPHTVSIKDYSLKALYQYYAVPKYDESAFLIARLTNWGEFNLLPGETNIYFENSYVGKTFLNPNISKDTLNVSLGRDDNFVVSRTQQKDFTEDKFLSKDIERTFAYEIKVKNNKKNSVNIIIEDQVPLSQQEDITVQLKDKGNASYNNEDGVLRWTANINAGSTFTSKYIFTVRYPSDKKIQGL